MTIRENMKSYNNEGKIKVYIAGPFFNEEQEERIEYIESLLEELDFDVFSPRQASKIKPGATQQDMIDTFNGNVDNIRNADFILAVLDGNDTGTMFEYGYAYAMTRDVLSFNETRDKGPNLMLAMSGKLPFITKQTTKLSDVLREDAFVGLEDKYLGELSPREMLRTILELMKKYGSFYYIEQFNKSQFDEVE